MARLKTREQQDDIRRAIFGMLALPTDKLLLIYARQSTKKQAIHNLESWRQQQEGLREQGIEYGWNESNTVLFVENLGKKGELKSVSGTLRIDQREGLSAVVEYIETGKVGAVLVVDVSRLFRDEDMVEPIVFARICKQHGVLVLTLDDTFNFNDERRDDLARFYMEAKAAADFIKKHVRGKMLKGRMNKAKRGEYAAGVPPIGFMVRSQATPNGIEKDTNYTPSPHAPYVEPLFQRFYDLDANFTQLYKEVAGRVVFPDVPGWTPEHRIYLSRVDGGYTIRSRSGLKYILTNLAYIGHYVWDGRIMKKNAHTAIVDERLFWFAWEHLSDTDIDGNMIERPKRAVRYTQTGTVNEALLAGTREDGRAVIGGVGKQRVYVMNHGGRKPTYEIRDTTRLSMNAFESEILVSTLDAIVVERVLLRVRVSQSNDDWAKRRALGLFGVNWQEIRGTMLHDVYQQVEQEDRDKQKKAPTQLDKSIMETEQNIASTERRIKVAGDLMTDGELREAYESLRRMRKNLAEMVDKRDRQAKIAAELAEAQADICSAPDCFYKWDLERQQRFIRLVTESITLEQVENGWLRLTLVWCPFSGIDATDTAYIWRVSGDGWSEQELALLQQHYRTAKRSELLGLLPDRSWAAIRATGNKKGLKRMFQHTDTDIPDNMSITDRHIMEKYELPMQTVLGVNMLDRRVWWQSVENLNYDGVS